MLKLRLIIASLSLFGRGVYIAPVVASVYNTVAAVTWLDCDYLYHQQAFTEKNAADYIATVLGLGRATIFNYSTSWRQTK